MARVVKAVREDRAEIDELGASVVARLYDVPWELFDSKDLASSGETRYMVSRIQEDLLKVAAADPVRAGRIWDELVPNYVPRPPELPEIEKEPLVENGIEPGRRRRKGKAEPFLDPSEAIGLGQADKDADWQARETRARQPNGRDELAKAPDNSARVQMLLDGISRQYVQADDKYHFRDRGGAVAFEARDKKLLTQHETPAVVTSMIDLAEARGWESIKLTGTKEFRREAWLQANLRDFEVSGYQPTKLDKARLEELRAERAPAASAPANSISEQKLAFAVADGQRPRFESVREDGRAEPKVPLTPAQDQSVRTMEAYMRHRGDSADAIAKARDLASERLTSDRVHMGTLVEFGTAPYQDKQGEKRTPFVALQDDKGQITKVWGVDLPRAVKESGAEPGQMIAVAFRGRQPVEVDVPIKDGKGLTGRIERKIVDRNTWEVVQFERLREEAKASVAKAVSRQNDPAALQVFDPAAKPARAAPEPAPSRERERSTAR